MVNTLRAADGKNRALRTFLVGLATDVLAAVVLLLAPLVTAAQSWGDFQWGVMGFMLAKTVVATLFSYLLRTVLDGKITPASILPPADPGPPADHDLPELGEGGFVHPIVAAMVAGFWGSVALLIATIGFWPTVLTFGLIFGSLAVLAYLPRERRQTRHKST